jgi:hypothetical protein
MKKPKTVADLLAVANICIEASEARTQLLYPCNGAYKEEEEVVRSGSQCNRLQE